jgi:hypothetical protein
MKNALAYYSAVSSKVVGLAPQVVETIKEK